MSGYGSIAKKIPFGTIAVVLGIFILLFWWQTGQWPWKSGTDTSKNT